MAMATTLQSSFVAGSVARFGGRTSAYSLPRRHALSGMRIRCQAEEKPSEQAAAETQPSQTPPPPATKATTTATTTTAAAATKVSNKFSDVLAFSGPAPERINGRLAMVGFVSAIAVEAARGDDLMVQLMNGGLLWFLGTTAVLSAASLVPLFRGVSVQSRSQGLMNSDAELWNGRFAMLGLVALAFTEYLKGGPLV